MIPIKSFPLKCLFLSLLIKLAKKISCDSQKSHKKKTWIDPLFNVELIVCYTNWMWKCYLQNWHTIRFPWFKVASNHISSIYLNIVVFLSLNTNFPSCSLSQRKQYLYENVTFQRNAPYISVLTSVHQSTLE